MNQEELNKILQNRKPGELLIWTNQNLSKLNLRRADLRAADLRYTNLRNADLSYANLRNADLSYANLRNADLSYADLRCADLRNADLRCADLRNADLRNADLRNANLKDADLSEAKLVLCKLPEDYPVCRIDFVGGWSICIYPDKTQIGCRCKSNKFWLNANKEKISALSYNAWKWWQIHGKAVKAAIRCVMKKGEE